MTTVRSGTIADLKPEKRSLNKYANNEKIIAHRGKSFVIRSIIIALFTRLISYNKISPKHMTLMNPIPYQVP